MTGEDDKETNTSIQQRIVSCEVTFNAGPLDDCDHPGSSPGFKIPPTSTKVTAYMAPSASMSKKEPSRSGPLSMMLELSGRDRLNVVDGVREVLHTLFSAVVGPVNVVGTNLIV